MEAEARRLEKKRERKRQERERKRAKENGTKVGGKGSSGGSGGDTGGEDSRNGWKELPLGIKFQDKSVGTGPRVEDRDRVRVSYVGRGGGDKGKVFDR